MCNLVRTSQVCHGLYLILMETHDGMYGTSTATSHVMTRLEQMPSVVSGK